MVGMKGVKRFSFGPSGAYPHVGFYPVLGNSLHRLGQRLVRGLLELEWRLLIATEPVD